MKRTSVFGGGRAARSRSDPELHRVRLTPQMLDYDRFSDRGGTNTLPYLMYFNSAGFTSAAINTDELGFRYATTPQGESISAGSRGAAAHFPVNLLVGSSAALGYGSTSDATSITSRLNEHQGGRTPWLNFSGHCYNSTQELMLYVLRQDLVPRVEQVVIVGGFNTLVMARLASMERQGLAPFYFCGEYFAKMDELRASRGGPPAGPEVRWPDPQAVPPRVADTIAAAVRVSVGHLRTWKQLCDAVGARLTFLVQPLATWVRPPCQEEALLFDELDRISSLGTWQELYGDISDPEVGSRYAAEVRRELVGSGVGFGNLADELATAAAPADWLYVDRAHFTDQGNDLVAQIITREVRSRS